MTLEDLANNNILPHAFRPNKILDEALRSNGGLMPLYNRGEDRVDLKQYFVQSADVIDDLISHTDTIQRMAKGIYESQLKGGKLLIAGNGGSCSQAEHFAGEMTCTFKDRRRRGFCAINLANNPSAITAWSNDFGFDSYFARQIESLGKSGDILFLISTGGGEKKASMNLVRAARKANQKMMTIYSLLGKTGGMLKDLSDEYIIVPSSDTSHIQEAHITIIHAICMELEDLCSR